MQVDSSRFLKFFLQFVASLQIIFAFSCQSQSDSKSTQLLAPTFPIINDQKIKYDLNKYPLSQVICDPFNSISQNRIDQGLKSELYYKLNDQPKFNSSTEYIQSAYKSDQTLFLKDLKIGARSLSDGFVNLSGNILKNDLNETLNEYFALNIKTFLMLGPEDAEGSYELALLSNDGSTLSLSSGQDDVPDELLIDNEGHHPTRMGCSNRTIRFRHNVLVPIKISYFQGPRNHMSLTLIWRKSSVAGEDSLCGQQGQNLFFNPDDSKNETKAWSDLKSRGWSVLQPQHFRMSTDTNEFNLCNSGSSPEIKNENLNLEPFPLLTWSTDLPSTSQVQIFSDEGLLIKTTHSDHFLRTQHQVSLEDLNPGRYKIKALSFTQDLGRSQGTEFNINIP